MTRTLVVRAAARAEIEQAAGWYERRQPELGEDFVVEIEATFARVLNAAEPCWTLELQKRAAQQGKGRTPAPAQGETGVRRYGGCGRI